MTTATLRVQSDTTTLLRALSKTFTRSSAVLGELLQNARRARATRVTISVSEAEITVEDDGIGFADFSVLLSEALLTKLVAVSPRDGNQSVATWSRTSLQHHR